MVWHVRDPARVSAKILTNFVVRESAVDQVESFSNESAKGRYLREGAIKNGKTKNMMSASEDNIAGAEETQLPSSDRRRDFFPLSDGIFLKAFKKSHSLRGGPGARQIRRHNQ